MKVVIIDDEPAMRLLITQFLKNKHHVISFSTGEDALQNLSSVEPDLLIVDMNLEGMDGLSIIKTIRSSEEHKHLPIIVLSGDDKSQSRIQALRTGADDYMIKPFNPEELEVRLEVIARRMIQA